MTHYSFTKAQFEKVVQQAKQEADAGNIEEAMCIAGQAVGALDAKLVRGKYVEELRGLARRYERMNQRGD